MTTGPAALAALGLAVVLVLAAVPARAQTPAQAAPRDQSQAQVNAVLRQDARIRESLMAAGIAAAIAQRCPTIEGRDMRARTDALGLYNHARGLGYTRQQIRSFIDDQAEKERMRGEIRAWFRARGLQDDGPAEGFCDLGRAQIAENAPAGRYLRAR